jgi:hypothetical protein
VLEQPTSAAQEFTVIALATVRNGLDVKKSKETRKLAPGVMVRSSSRCVFSKWPKCCWKKGLARHSARHDQLSPCGRRLIARWVCWVMTLYE